MDPSQIYRRIFKRSTQDDVDVVADDAFRAANFVDFFGNIWLPANIKALSFDSVLRPFWDASQQDPPRNSFAIYCVADGGNIKATNENAIWLNQHIRFVAFVSGSDQGSETPFADRTPKSWTLCIVGSQDLQTEHRFLQVASWDGKTFRYYGRDPVQLEGVDPDQWVPGWVYQGESAGAFASESYLGPFNGHVNGSLVMKELRKPWLHWRTDDFDPTSNFPQSIKDSLSKEKAPYLSDGALLSNVQSAEAMMGFMTSGVTKYQRFRANMNFVDTNNQPLPHVSGIKRWMAHILLTTTVNIGTALASNGNNYTLPANHVYNFELASNFNDTKIWPKTMPLLNFDRSLYQSAVNQDLQLALIQDVDPANPPKGFPIYELQPGTLGGGKDPPSKVTVIQVEAGEGDGGIFTTLHPSFEDVAGVEIFMKLKVPFISSTTYNALVMIDACNPVYSWRRGVLLQYVPDTATYDPATKTYDMEEQFKQNIQASPRFKDTTSPEYEFFQNLKPENQQSFSKQMSTYFNQIVNRLKTQSGIADYLKLAESRRRIYRPVPLDEFALTLPYALKWPYDKPFEMVKDGTIREMEDRGVRFFATWIGSLSGPDPKILPTPDAEDVNDSAVLSSLQAAMSVTQASGFAVSCESSLGTSKARKGGCPFQPRSMKGIKLTAAVDTSSQPTWDDDVINLFVEPYWITPPSRSKSVGNGWKDAMLRFGAPMPDGKPLTLDNYEHVKLQAVTIYQHCASRSMPVTSDDSQYWPKDALELFRQWVNQGCRKSRDQPINPATRIPEAVLPTAKIRVRKDVRDLTPIEVQIFRAKVQDVLQVESLPSRWQELGELHAWWCLHYQEATFLWHRCWLKYVEDLIDFPIPYWNGFASDITNPDSQYAGLPQIFLDDEYVHPDGSTRKNPLKFALSYKAKSKDGTSQYVQRDPILVNGRPSKSGPALDAWNAKIAFLSKYQAQIVSAMQHETFSTPQGIGIAWAALPAFLQDMPDSDYASQTSFDGWFEQPHDNFHGWIGGITGDMADNTYTAFDPMFLSYHCNMDRLVEHYLRSMPHMQFSANFPLRPFVKNATELDLTNPNSWAYTTIGDMTKNVQALGYVYAPPACPDIFTPSKAPQASNSTGGSAMTLVDKATVPAYKLSSARTPFIVFRDVICTERSYEIDVFLKTAESTDPDPVRNPDFVGRLFRFGMGRPPNGVEMRNKKRCQKNAVTRIIEVEDRHKGTIEGGFLQIVRELPGISCGGDANARELPESEWMGMRGFKGELIWVCS